MKEKFFFQAKGHYHVLLTPPKSSPRKRKITVVGMQHLSGIEQSDSKEEISCLKWTKYKDRRTICANLKIETDKVNIVVYRYRNNFYLKHNKVDLKLAEYKSLLTN